VIDASARAGPAAARNAGVDAAQGQFVAFCDADDVVRPGWLSAYVTALADADVVAGYFDLHSLNDGVDGELGPAATSQLGFLPAGLAANLAVRREAFTAVGGFAETLFVGDCSSRDTDSPSPILPLWPGVSAQIFENFLLVPSPTAGAAHICTGRTASEGRGAIWRVRRGLGSGWSCRCPGSVVPISDSNGYAPSAFASAVSRGLSRSASSSLDHAALGASQKPKV
jgi:hypothetical protein